MRKIRFFKVFTGVLLLCSLVLVFSCGRQEQASSSATPVSSIEWKMVTTWPKDFPGVGIGANNLAKLVEEMSGGRLKIKVYGGGELVGALEVFDAVSRGTAEMGHGAAYYWKGKSPATQFFTAVPFGFTANEINAWYYYGGGKALWEEVYDKFNLIPLSAGNTGVQMGGWFNKEINSVEDLKGLKMRLPGLGGEVLKRLGGTPVLLPGGELFAALESGVIDATEWIGPYNDLSFGFYKAAKYYYYPGWHEPGSLLEAMVNKEAFNQLPKDLQAIVRTAATAITTDMTAEYNARSARALDSLINDHGVILKKFPDSVIKEIAKASEEVLKEEASKDELTKRVYESYLAFKEQIDRWTEISEFSYLKARALK